MTNAQETPKVLFLGASIVSGYGLPDDQALPSMFKNQAMAAGVSLSVRNEAVPGAATNHGLSQLKNAINSGFIPDHVFIALGLSDAIYRVEPKEIKARLKEMISAVRVENPKAQIYLFQARIFQRHVTSRVAAKGSDYEMAYESIFREVASEDKLVLLSFLLREIEGQMSYFQSDQLHPNARGVKKMSIQVWEESQQYFH